MMDANQQPSAGSIGPDTTQCREPDCGVKRLHAHCGRRECRKHCRKNGGCEVPDHMVDPATAVPALYGENASHNQIVSQQDIQIPPPLQIAVSASRPATRSHGSVVTSALSSLSAPLPLSSQPCLPLSRPPSRPSSRSQPLLPSIPEDNHISTTTSSASIAHSIRSGDSRPKDNSPSTASSSRADIPLVATLAASVSTSTTTTSAAVGLEARSLPRDPGFAVADIGQTVRHKTQMKAVFTSRRIEEDKLVAEQRKINAALIESEKTEQQRIYVHVWTQVNNYQLYTIYILLIVFFPLE